MTSAIAVAVGVTAVLVAIKNIEDAWDRWSLARLKRRARRTTAARVLRMRADIDPDWEDLAR